MTMTMTMPVLITMMKDDKNDDNYIDEKDDQWSWKYENGEDYNYDDDDDDCFSAEEIDDKDDDRDDKWPWKYKNGED